MFTELVTNLIKYKKENCILSLQMFETIKQMIQEDLISAYELSQPLVNENISLFKNNTSYLNFLLQLFSIKETPNENSLYFKTPNQIDDSIADSISKSELVADSTADSIIKSESVADSTAESESVADSDILKDYYEDDYFNDYKKETVQEPYDSLDTQDFCTTIMEIFKEDSYTLSNQEECQQHVLDLIENMKGENQLLHDVNLKNVNFQEDIVRRLTRKPIVEKEKTLDEYRGVVLTLIESHDFYKKVLSRLTTLEFDTNQTVDHNQNVILNLLDDQFNFYKTVIHKLTNQEALANRTSKYYRDEIYKLIDARYVFMFKDDSTAEEHRKRLLNNDCPIFYKRILEKFKILNVESDCEKFILQKIDEQNNLLSKHLEFYREMCDGEEKTTIDGYHGAIKNKIKDLTIRLKNTVIEKNNVSSELTMKYEELEKQLYAAQNLKEESSIFEEKDNLIRELRNQNDKLQIDFSIKANLLNGTISKLKDEYKSVQTAKSKCIDRCITLESLVDTHQQKILHLTGEIEHYKTNNRDSNEKLETLKHEYEANVRNLKNNNDNLKKLNSEISATIADYENNFEALQQELSKTKKELNSKRLELEGYREVVNVNNIVENDSTRYEMLQHLFVQFLIYHFALYYKSLDGKPTVSHQDELDKLSALAKNLRTINLRIHRDDITNILLQYVLLQINTLGHEKIQLCEAVEIKNVDMERYVEKALRFIKSNYMNETVFDLCEKYNLEYNELDKILNAFVAVVKLHRNETNVHDAIHDMCDIIRDASLNSQMSINVWLSKQLKSKKSFKIIN